MRASRLRTFAAPPPVDRRDRVFPARFIARRIDWGHTVP